MNPPPTDLQSHHRRLGMGTDDRQRHPYYLCHTYYHAYVAMVLAYGEWKAGRAPTIALAFTKNRLSDRFLERAQALPWTQVANVTNQEAVRRIGRMLPPTKLLLNLFLANWFPKLDKQAAALPHPDSVDLHLFSDFHYIARYLLHRASLPVTLVEDGHANYRTRPRTLKGGVKRLIGLQAKFGRDPKITRILVQVPEALPKDIHAKGVSLAFRQQLQQLSDDARDRILAAFLGERVFALGAATVLVLTQPFYDFGLLRHARHVELYESIVDTLCSAGFAVYVKPHPSDSVDYACLGDRVQCLPADFPIEVLNACMGTRIAAAVGLSTSAVDNIRFAKRTLNLLPGDRELRRDFRRKLERVRTQLRDLPAPTGHAKLDMPEPDGRTEGADQWS